MKNRIMSLILVITLLCTMIPRISLIASAETVASGTSNDGLTWTLDSDGILIISGEGSMEDHSPAGAGYGSWVYANLDYEYRDSVNKVILQPGITHIGESAFAYCENLTSIEIPETVTSIGAWAFLECSSLSNIEIPNGVSTIGMLTFQGSGLTSITIPASVTLLESQAFGWCEKLSSIHFLGNAPIFGNDEFDLTSLFFNVTATVYYPANNSTWTLDLMQNYGGILTWTPYDEQSGGATTEKNIFELFVPVVESRIDKSKYDELTTVKQCECRGLLQDLDNDGEYELILRYLDEWSDVIFEIWTIQNGSPVCANTITLGKDGLETNGCLSAAKYDGQHYIVYEWMSSGMDQINDEYEIYRIEGGVFERAKSISPKTFDNPGVIMRAGYYLDDNEVAEGMIFPDLLAYLKENPTNNDEPITIPEPIHYLTGFNIPVFTAAVVCCCVIALIFVFKFKSKKRK